MSQSTEPTSTDQKEEIKRAIRAIKAANWRLGEIMEEQKKHISDETDIPLIFIEAGKEALDVISNAYDHLGGLLDLDSSVSEGETLPHRNAYIYYRDS